MDQTYSTGPDDESGMSSSETTQFHVSRSKFDHQLPEYLGNYQLLREIGRGGMGTVYEAMERGLNRRVALKVLPSTSSKREVHRQRFLNEARAAAQLNHANIVPVYQVGEDAGWHFFAMKLIDGCDLSEVIHHARESIQAMNDQADSPTKPTGNFAVVDTDADSSLRSTIDLSADVFSDSMKRNGHRSATRLAHAVASIGYQIADALHHAHQCGIIHRDIKPSNVMMDRDGKIWITDFGLAHLQNEPAVTQTGDIVGTWRYMSPEQATGRRTFLDHRTDIYSLGVALYELATLKSACRGANAREILRELTLERPTPVRKLNPHLPVDFETIICKATERNPDDRYQTAAEFAADLKRLANNQKITTRRTSHWRHWQDWLSDRPAVIAATLFLAVTIVATLGTFTWALNHRLNISEGERLRAESAVALSKDKNPGKALENAIAAAQATPGYKSDQAILAALDNLYESRRILIGDAEPGELVFSPDGNKLLKCVDSRLFTRKLGRTELYDVDKGVKLHELKHDQPITTAAYSPTGNQLLTAGTSFPFALPNSKDKPLAARFGYAPVAVWKPQALDEPPRILQQTRAWRLDSACFSRIEPRVVLPAAEGNQAIVFNMEDWSREEMRLSGGHTDFVLQAVYSPDAKWIATWAADQKLVLWDAAQAKPVRTVPYATQVPLHTTIAFAPDSKSLMVQGHSGTLIVPVDGHAEPEFHSVTYARFATDDGRILVRDLLDMVIRVLRSPTAKPVECTSETRLTETIWHNQGRTIAAISDQALSVTLFDSWSGKQLAKLQGHTDWINHIQSRPGSEQLASVSWDQTIRIWNVRSNAEKRRMPLAQSLETSSLALSPSQDKAVVSSISGKRCTVLPKNPNEAARQSFSGKVVYVDNDETIYVADGTKLTLFDADARARKHEFILSSETVENVISVGELKDKLVATTEGTLLRLSADEHKLTPLATGYTVSAIAGHPTQSQAILGTLDGKLVQVDLNSGKVTGLLSFNSSIFHIDFDLKGEQLLITTEDDRIILVDWRKPEIIRTIQGKSSQVVQAWFTYDGQHAVSHASFEADSVCLWDLKTGELKQTIEAKFVNEALPDAQRQRFAFATQYSGALLWDTSSGKQTRITELPSRNVAFQQNKLFISTSTAQLDALASMGADAQPAMIAKLIEWNLATHSIDSDRTLGFATESLYIAANSGNIYASAKLYGAAVFSVANSELVSELLGHSEGLLVADYLPDGKSILTVSRDGHILIHDLANTSYRSLGNHAFTLSAAALSADRTQLVTAESNGQVTQWDLKQLSKVRTEKVLEGDKFVQLAFLADQNGLAALTKSGMLRWWDLKTWQINSLPGEHRGWKIATSARVGEVLLICGTRSETQPSRMFDLAPGNEDRTDMLLIDLKNPATPQGITVTGRIAAARFLPTDNRIAAITDRGQLCVWESKPLKKVKEVSTSPRACCLLPVSVSDRSFYAASEQNIYGWDCRTLEPIVDVELSRASTQSSAYPLAWTVETKEGWLLLNDPAGIAKIPIDPLAYARSISPQAQ